MSNHTDAVVPDLSASLEYQKCFVNIPVQATNPIKRSWTISANMLFNLKSNPAGKPETRHTSVRVETGLAWAGRSGRKLLGKTKYGV